MGRFAKRVREVRRPGGVLSGVAGSPFGDGHPAVWEYLTLDVDEDAGPRQTASFLVVCDSGKLKVWVNDRENGRTCWVSGDTWEGVWAAVEAALQSDGADWRAAKAEGSRGKRR